MGQRHNADKARRLSTCSPSRWAGILKIGVGHSANFVCGEVKVVFRPKVKHVARLTWERRWIQGRPAALASRNLPAWSADRQARGALTTDDRGSEFAGYQKVGVALGREWMLLRILPLPEKGSS